MCGEEAAAVGEQQSQLCGRRAAEREKWKHIVCKVCEAILVQKFSLALRWRKIRCDKEITGTDRKAKKESHMIFVHITSF